MKTLHLKPAEGRLIRDPATGRPIPASGAAVPDTPYWRRLRRDGDVVDTTAEAIAAEAGVSTEEPSPIRSRRRSTEQ